MCRAGERLQAAYTTINSGCHRKRFISKASQHQVGRFRLNFAGIQEEDMLRLQSSDMLGWSTMKRTAGTKILNEMISENFEAFPKDFSLFEHGRSLRINVKGGVVFLHVIRACETRLDEDCQTQEVDYRCWYLAEKRLIVWQKSCVAQDEMAAIDYFTQTYHGTRPFVASDLPSNIANEGALLENMHGRNLHRDSCVDTNFVGSVCATSFVVHVAHTTERVCFVFENTIKNKKANSDFAYPKPVNICYTGSVHGNICSENISAEMHQAKHNGPCGSEIHVDTSMGVMQIFGKNGGSRKITCKAFVNIKEANFIVQRVCNMVNPHHAHQHVCCIFLRGNLDISYSHLTQLFWGDTGKMMSELYHNSTPPRYIKSIVLTT